MTVDFLALATTASFFLLMVGMVCSFLRILRGPSLADRVVALDMLTLLMVCFAGVFAIAADEVAFLDVAIALALIGFLGTVAFARYAERLHGRRGEKAPAGGVQDG